MATPAAAAADRFSGLYRAFEIVADSLPLSVCAAVLFYGTPAVLFYGTACFLPASRLLVSPPVAPPSLLGWARCPKGFSVSTSIRFGRLT